MSKAPAIAKVSGATISAGLVPVGGMVAPLNLDVTDPEKETYGVKVKLPAHFKDASGRPINFLFSNSAGTVHRAQHIPDHVVLIALV